MLKTKILLVEDENIVAKDIENMLDRLGYNIVDNVTTGEASIKKVEEKHPDLVLMDIILRGKMDGVQASEEIKNRFNIPVVYVTAYADDITLQRAKITEPFGYILKPFEERELFVVIEMALHRHKLENKIKESEEWLSITLRSISDAVIATDNKRNVTFINPIAEEFTGWTQKEATGKPLSLIFNTINRDTNKKLVEPISKIYQEGVIVRFPRHTSLIIKNGKQKPIDGSGAPIKDFNGVITGVVFAFTDITERVKSENIQSALYNISNAVNTTKNIDELIKIIHSQLSRIIDTTNFYVALYNKETDTISLPYDVDQKDKFTTFPAGKTLTAYVIRTGKSLLVDEEVNNKLIQEGEVDMIGTPSKIWLGVPLKVEEEIIGVVTVQSYEDSTIYTKKDLEILEFISEQIAIAIAHTRADNELRISEEKFRDLFENANDAIWTSDVNGKYVSVNHLFEKLLGYTKKDLINKQSIDLIAEEDRKKSIEYYQEVISGKPISFETTILTKNNEKKIFWLRLRPIKERGKIIGAHGIGRDITEKIKAQKALKLSEEQLRQAQKMEAIGRLAGGVAHDFNNLLLAINGRCDLLIKKIDANNPFKKDIAEIRKSGERAASLTQQLLTFSRKQVIQPKVINLNDLITDIEKMLKRLIGEDIKLETFPNPKLGYVRVDKGQVDQILMNLSVNARDAMIDGGKLIIETNNIDVDEKFCGSHIEIQPGQYVRLTVTDTGCGMDENTMSRIFEPFFTTKEVGKGTGLGLSTVYGIVKQNNGYMDVYSEPEIGSTFKIYLPRVIAEKKVESKKLFEPIIEASGGTETILLVEDEEAVRDLVSEIIEENGYNIITASEPSEAIFICKKRSKPIDLMITDVVMPGMSGNVLSAKLKPLYPEMKVLFISGYTGKEIVDRGILKPGTKFLQKPFTPDSLIRKIRKVLDEY